MKRKPKRTSVAILFQECWHDFIRGGYSSNTELIVIHDFFSETESVYIISPALTRVELLYKKVS